MTSRLPGRAKIVAKAIMHRLLTAGRRRKPVDPQRILVAHHLLLGDTLMLTPLLSKLRRCYPSADIVMAVAEAYAPLYAGHPYGVRVHAWSPRHVGRGALFDEAPFDLALVPGDNRHSWLAAALGARWIVAFEGDRPAYKNWPIDELRPFSKVPGTWGDLTSELVTGPAPPPFAPDQWPAPAGSAPAIANGPYALLHVGASNALKHWDPRRWFELALRLQERGLTPVWSGGPGEVSIVEACDPQQRFPSQAGRLSLPQLWHVAKQAHVIVSPDTSVAHLGRIVGAPTVTLFGPGSAVICGAGDFWRNAVYAAVTIDPFPCRDQRILFRREIEWVRRCGRSTAECSAPRCMRAIEVQMVLDAIASLGVLEARSTVTNPLP